MNTITRMAEKIYTDREYLDLKFDTVKDSIEKVEKLLHPVQTKVESLEKEMQSSKTKMNAIMFISGAAVIAALRAFFIKIGF